MFIKCIKLIRSTNYCKYSTYKQLTSIISPFQNTRKPQSELDLIDLENKRPFHVCFRTAMSKRLFEDKEHAELYAQYRPSYPDAVFKTIVDFYETGKSHECNFDILVDVGCGNGQSSRPFCKYFSQVIGTDVSEKQISSAKKDIDNLMFRVSPGENLSFLEDSSVDVVTIAQALHWLDRPAFYKEVERVLKPRGVLVAFGYGQNILDDEKADKCVEEFYNGLLGDYWDKARHHIENHFREFELPFPNSRRIENEAISIRRSMPLDAYIGYLSTWSAWRQYLKTHAESDDLTKVRERLSAIYKNKTGEDNSVINVYWPGFMLIGRKPIT